MNSDTEAVIDELYNLGFRLGINPRAVKDAVERADDLRELLRRWKREYKKAERRILAADERSIEQKNAVGSNERHTELQRQHAASRRAARERMSLGGRVDALRAETVLEPGPGVAALGATKVLGGEGKQAPPDPALFRTRLGMTVDAHWRWILRHLEMVEEDWDEFLGRGTSRSWSTATTDEKDREIVTKYVGVDSREVALINPELGSARAIESVRRRYKLHGKTGEPK